MSTVRKVCLIVVIIFITSVASKLTTKQNKLLSQRTKRSDQSLSYRLPNNSLPIRYDLWIKTDIHNGDLKFNGRVKIQINIIEASETITMHSRDIIIDKVDLTDKTSNLNKSSLEFEYVKQQDFLVIVLPSIVNVNDEIMLDIEYHGNMTSNEMSGLYATSYQNEANERVWLASTYFLPISARKAFPCYDEPQIRVPIKLEIQHDKSYHTISNMQKSKVETLSAFSSYETTTFFDTPPIPTHLLAFVVSDLESISNKNKQLEQSIYGEPLKILNGTAKFALKIVDEVLNKFSEVLPIELGITKIDHVQIPSLNGGLEQYGLITYEESSLLLDENFFTEEVQEYFKPQIISAISHCIAHQYFGSIVSNNWWQYLWLNEGITIFFQFHISDLIHPEFDYMSLFEDLIIQPLFGFDIGRKETINDYVESPTEIDQKFSSFIVDKSAVIIRMFYEALSPSTFTKGLTYFLNDMRFKAANSLDLHKALQKAFDDDNPQKTLNISKLMLSWEELPGYPVISVKKSGNDVILTQKRFPDEQVNEFYAIPLSFATKTNPNFNEKTAQQWMTTEAIKLNNILNTSDEWIIFNIQLVGFYRVDYSRELWDVIIKGYKENIGIIHHVNRKVLHEEMYLGWKVFKTTTASHCLEFMSVLEYETSGIIWMTASRYLEDLYTFLRFSDVYENFQTKMHEILQPHLKASASKAVDMEFPVEIKKWSIMSQHPEFLQQQLNQLLIYLQTNSISDKPDLCSALSIANETIYRHYIDEVIHFEIFLDMEIVGLGCSLNRTLLEEMFAAFLNPVNGVEPYFMTNVIEVTIDSSVVGLETVMDLISDKWWDINKLQPDDQYVITIVSKIHELINSQKHIEKFKTLTTKLIQNGAMPPELVTKQLKDIEAKLEDEEWKNIKEWFGIEEEEQTSSTITSTSPAEDTTLDAVSLSTSIRIIAICISLCFLLKQKFT